MLFSQACTEYLGSTFGATPVDLLAVSMATEPVPSTYLQTCPQVGLESIVYDKYFFVLLILTQGERE